MADHPLTLMEFIKELLGLHSDSIELRSAFEKDPQTTLAQHGLGHLTAADVDDALVLFQDNDTVSFDKHYDTGSNAIGATWGAHDEHGSIEWAKASVHTAGGHWETHEHVTNNHVTNNVDDRDMILDQSVNQNVDTGGGAFDQTIDNNSVNAAGDGSVAAGDDIEGSTITTGDGNVVGNGNEVVNGDGNTTAYGTGSAVKGVSVDDGSAFSANGPASVDNSTDGSHNRTVTEDNDHTDIQGSHNVDTDNSVDNSLVDDSQTHIGSYNDADLHFG